MLQGQELVQFCQENEGMSMKDLAKAAGYVRTTESGRPFTQMKAFRAALEEAGAADIRIGARVGKKPQFETTVHANGNLLVGKVYTEQFGATSGQRFAIELGEDVITLRPKLDGV